MNEKIYDYIIIGAGSAGLSIGQLLSKTGLNVLILESHFLPGGCASFFKRGKYSFDVGATTISSMQNDRPLIKFLNMTGIELPVIKVDPGIVFHINDKEINRYCDNLKWINEFEEKLNCSHTKKYWEDSFSLYQKAWQLTYDYPHFPSLKLKFIPEYLNPLKIKNFKFLPHLKKSAFEELPIEIKKNQNAIKILNELLFITAQNNLYNTPELLALFGLFYPEDSYYPIGGMENVVKRLANGLQIKYREAVMKVSKSNNCFGVHSKTNFYKAKNIISTIPINNLAKILDPDQNILGFNKNVDRECWSALTLYFVIPTIEINSPYHQIHFDDKDDIEDLNIKSFFVSFSLPQDSIRNHSDEMTVTISIHIRPEQFYNLGEFEYNIKKEKYKNIILKKFFSIFQLSEDKIKHLNIGTPLTFERYTGRHLGLVGGIPHDLKRIPFGLNSSYTNDPNFFLLGDNIFPGQGIAGTILGSLNLYKNLK